jgi:cell shape-determining protein MreD
MDTLTGGILGLYLTTYIWLYIGVAWLRTFMRAGNHLLLPIVVVAGVLIQNGVFLGYVTLLAPNTQVPKAAWSTVIAQLVWAFLTGPFILVLFSLAHDRWERWRRDILAEHAGPAEGKMLDSTSLASAERRTIVSRSGR